MTVASAPPGWPEPLGPEAFHGPLGDLVRAIEPHTEADPVAILVQGLVAFGNVIGPRPHFRVESDSHHMNLFCALVGDTSKARKGTSWGHVHRVFAAIDQTWKPCVKSGLSSGEGLIWAVRDDAPDGVQAPAPDRRLMVVEGEFSSTLRVLGRDGNTLSAQLRQAWDSGNLKVLTRNCPVESTGAHISLISHITQSELRRYLTSVEMGNGFANRFLWLCVHRSKVLPEGGCLKEVDLASIEQRLRAAVDAARAVEGIQRDESARELWREVYPTLSEGRPGLLGFVTSRAEAQVMRLACIYALLDASNLVRAEHLKAALSLWRFCDDSARFIFGDDVGDPLADNVLRRLQREPNGGTRTDISAWLGRHVRSSEIDRALSLLEGQRLVKRETTPTGGRPTETWVALPGARKAQEAK
jgi:hypothetical protein